MSNGLIYTKALKIALTMITVPEMPYDNRDYQKLAIERRNAFSYPATFGEKSDESLQGPHHLFEQTEHHHVNQHNEDAK